MIIVRQRAGLQALASFTYKQLLNERRLEFAIEGDYWYDLQRIDGFNNAHHPTAIAMINAQDRRTVNVDNTTGQITSYNVGRSYSLSDANFILPYPVPETAANPSLLMPPVPYKF